MAVLIGVSPEVKGKNFSIDKSPFTIGNATDNIVHLAVPGISGHHCEIVTEGEKFILRDHGSTNGTRVNNHDITEHTLRAGEIIAVGTIEFLFNAEGADDTAIGGTATPDVIEEASGGSGQPTGFDSISPFGQRHREPTGRMNAALIILGILALAASAFVFYKLLG